jgi:hypothetical protein
MTSRERIVFLDLVSLHQELKDALIPIFETVFRTSACVEGRMVETSEREFSAYCDTPYCVGVGRSATSQ